MATFQLRVGRVFHFNPTRDAWLRLVGAVRPLANDAFEIVITRPREQFAAAGTNGINVPQPGFTTRHDGSEAPLALNQRARRYILAVKCEHIEGNVERSLAIDVAFDEWIAPGGIGRVSVVDGLGVMCGAVAGIVAGLAEYL